MLLSTQIEVLNWMQCSVHHDTIGSNSGNVAIDPAIGGYGVADIYLREFLPHRDLVSFLDRAVRYRRNPRALVQ